MNKVKEEPIDRSIENKESNEKGNEIDDNYPRTKSNYNISDENYQWSAKASGLKDALDNLIQALKIVDIKYKELSRDEINNQEAKQRLES